MITVLMEPGPVNSGIASGTTAMLFLISASCRSSGVERALPVCAFNMLMAISNMMMPPPTSSEPTEIPKNAMICCPSNAVTAITQKTEMDAIRIGPAFSARDISVVRLRKNGIAPTGFISASNDINDLSRFIGGAPKRCFDTSRGFYPALEAALGRRNLPGRAVVQLHGHAQRAPGRLENGFHLMMRVDAAQIIDVKRHARVIHESAEKFDGQIHVERANARTRERHVELQPRTPRKVDDHARQRFVERHVRMAVSADAFAVANCLRHRLAERDARVFHRVMVVDMKVAMRFHVEVDQAVTCDLVKHVVEKRHARSKFLLAGAIQIELHTDLRFAGVANDFRNTHGISFETFKRFQCSASFKAAIICAFSSADPTVKRTQFANNGCILLTFLIKTRDVSRVSKTAAASGTRTSRKLPALG